MERSALFSDEQTDIAIDIVHMVESAAREKRPLPEPDDVARWEKEAEAGNNEAYKKLMCAKLYMIYPEIPGTSGGSNWARLWNSIVSGRLEGILVINSLDYRKAYEAYAWPPKLGTYLERWMAYALKNELAKAIIAGYDPRSRQNK